MKLALAQIDARLGDLDGICARLEQQVLVAGEAGADLLCLPSPLFTGVTPSALVDYPNFEHDLLHHLERVATVIATSGVACLVPVVLPLEGGPLFEVMLIKRGRVVPLRLTKIRFGEQMPASPWAPPVFELAGARIAVTFDVLRDITEIPRGCDLVVYLPVNGFDASDPTTSAIAAVPGGAFSQEVRDAGLWMACMAPVGGFDSSVYTGGSFVMDDSGRVVAQAPCFEEHLLIQEIRRGMPTDVLGAHELPAYDKHAWLWEALRLYLRDAVEASSTERVIVPLTGDLPSSLLAVLASDALGPRKVIGLYIDRALAVTPADEADAQERAAHVRELASALHIRLVERTAPDVSLVLDRDVATGSSACQRAWVDSLLLVDTAQEQRALALSPLTKTDYALRAVAAAEVNRAQLAPFGDVFYSELEYLARRRNGASAIVPEALLSTDGMARGMRSITRDAMEALDFAPEYVELAQNILGNIGFSALDRALSEHIEGNRVLEEIELFASVPEAAGLLVLLTRVNESGRHMLPSYPIVSARSFAERIWPASLAWSDLGRNGAEPLHAADFVEAEYRRLEARGEQRGKLARNEVLGLLGEMLGLSPEQQEELLSDKGQQRMQEELQEMEGNLREMLRRMAEQSGGSASSDAQAPPAGMPMSSPGFTFFSLN